jgi:hypothetical protein
MPLAVGSNALVLTLVFVVPAALAAVVSVRVRWLLLAGVVLAAIWYVAAVSDEDPDDFGPAASALLTLFLLLVLSAGVAAGRLLARTLASRR